VFLQSQLGTLEHPLAKLKAKCYLYLLVRVMIEYKMRNHTSRAPKKPITTKPHSYHQQYHCRATAIHFPVLLIITCILSYTDQCAAFIVPRTSIVQRTLLRVPTTSTSNSNGGGIFLHKQSIKTTQSQSTRRFHRKYARTTQTSIHAKKKEEVDDEAIQDEKDASMMNKMVRLGSRVMSSVKGEKTPSQSPQDDDDDDDDAEEDTKTMGWVRRLAQTPPKKKNQENDTAENAKDSTSRPATTPRAVNPFGAPAFPDIFKSEVALGNELKKQKALNNYISGDQDQIPQEFLPVVPKDGSLGLDQALSTIDNSLSYIRNQLSSVRFNANDESNNIFLTPQREEQRLDQIRKDLEIRRKNLIIETEKRKKEKDANARVTGEKLRMAAARDKRAKEERLENEKKIKERTERQKNILNAAKGKSGKSVDAAVEIDAEEQAGGRMGNLVEGAMAVAQSTFSNAWQTVRSKVALSKNDDDEWIPVCPKTRVSPGEVYPVVAGGLDLLIIGSKDGTKVFCVENTCPHLGTPLETGMIERRPCPKLAGPSVQSNSLSTDDDTKQSANDGFEDCIVCPLHQTAFSLDTGVVRGAWCPYPPILGKVMGTVKARNDLTTFKMRTRGKNIEIKISSTLDD